MLTHSVHILFSLHTADGRVVRSGSPLREAGLHPRSARGGRDLRPGEMRARCCCTEAGKGGGGRSFVHFAPIFGRPILEAVCAWLEITTTLRCYWCALLGHVARVRFLCFLYRGCFPLLHSIPCVYPSLQGQFSKYLCDPPPAPVHWIRADFGPVLVSPHRSVLAPWRCCTCPQRDSTTSVS